MLFESFWMYLAIFNIKMPLYFKVKKLVLLTFNSANIRKELVPLKIPILIQSENF